MILVYLFFFYILYRISINDITYGKIPNSLLILLLLIEILFLKANLISGFYYSFSFFLIYIIGNLLKKEFVGAGDIKMIFTVGTILERNIINFYHFVFLVTVFAIFNSFGRKRVPLAPAISLATLFLYFRR